MSEQSDNLDRVSERIAPAILQFYEQRKRINNPHFIASDLRNHVIRCIGLGVAPASPDRILRDLRKRHLLDYRVVSRSQSMYEFVWCDQPELF